MRAIQTDRRTFLINASVVALIGSMASACGESGKTSDATLEEFRTQLLKPLEKTTEAAEFGRKYLSMHDQTFEREVLLASISDAMSTHSGDDVSALNEAIETDYATSQVVSIDGWIISEVEAQVYAVLYLETQAL